MRRLLGTELLESRHLLTAIVMTDQEQLLLELINRARANPEAEAARYGIELNDDLEPNEISSDPKQPVAPNQMLITAARRHADDMLAREFFEHENPDGEGPSDRARDAGYPTGVGENIAWFGKPGLLERDPEVYRRHEALFLSPPHRANMLNGGYREVGNGVRYGEYSRLNSIMVAESFGNRGGDFFITGVAYNDLVQPDRFYTIGESLESINVVATRNRDSAVYSTTTGPSGGYSLRVPAGVYTVTARGPGISSAISVANVTMLGGNGKVDFNSREDGLSSIVGALFDDQDRDGLRDLQESTLADRIVYIDADGDGVWDPDETSTLTNPQGGYRFDHLRPGSYQLNQQLPEGWESSIEQDNSVEVQLTADQNASGVDIGSYVVNHKPVAQPDAYTTASGRPVSMDVFANDTDPDGELVLTSTRILVAPQHGEVVLNTSTGMLVFTPNDGFVGTDHFQYAVTDDGGLTSEGVDVNITVTRAVGTSWQNPLTSQDVNGDTFVSSIDALLILNRLNTIGAGPLEFPSDGQSPPPYFDPSGDGFISPIDALMVLNEVNRITSQRRSALRAEGESAPAVSSPATNALIASAVDHVFHSLQRDKSSATRSK